MNPAHGLSLNLSATASLATAVRESPTREPSGRWSVVVLFALAMAWVESAVVFYLRTMVNRIEPHQPNPLPDFGGLAGAELVREFATLVMLGTVGWLAGRTWRARIAYALLAFGVWDIAYYLWLVPLTGWPHSLTDWDILFLIPVPWWGPIWAPMSIATLMILFGTTIAMGDSAERPLVPSRTSCFCACVGVGLALYVFMADSLRVLFANGSAEQLRATLPQWFNWPLFVTALAFLAAPVVSIFRKTKSKIAQQTATLDCSRWIKHFQRNRANRIEPDWSAPITLRPEVVASVLPSLEQFQLGDGGGECRLIAFDAETFVGRSEEVRRLVNLWFAEEAEHARLLGCVVDRFGGHRINSHWSFTAFCQIRRLCGVRFELQVLTLTELVSTAYYRVLRRHVGDPALRDTCSLILRDEAGHVVFHRYRLATAARPEKGIMAAFWRAQFWLCGYAAATVLWISHRRCLCALRGTRDEYFGEVRRQIARFVAGMFAQRRNLNVASRSENQISQTTKT